MSAETSKIVTYAVVSDADDKVYTTKVITFAVVEPFKGVPVTVVVN